MDIQAYIATGIIDSYVLGLTTPEETSEVESLARQYPALQKEIDDIRASLETYAQQFVQTPPPGLKDKIWAALSEEEDKSNGTFLAPQADSQSDSITQIKHSEEEIKIVPEVSFWRNYGVAASIILLIASLSYNLFLMNRLKQTENRLAQAENERFSLAQQAKFNEIRYKDASTALAYYQNPDNEVVQLKGTQPTNQNTGAVVFWNRKEQRVFLAVQNMPAPPPGKQYQLWAIVDKKPVDAGVFSTQPVAVQSLKEIGQAQAFAVTLENEGGSPVPTSDVLMLGEV